MNPRRAAVGGMVVVASVMVWLAWSLPPHAFYAGDSGVKLIAAQNVIAHPTRPLQVDLPTIGGTPVTYVERFFTVHGQHAHVLQSPVFPVLSAPFIAWFGLRGAYVLPLLAFLALLPLLDLARQRVLPDVPAAWLAAVAALASPVFFYALEYWEHVPAIACVAAATVLVWYGREIGWAPFLAGIASGLAALLRPEAVWYIAVLAWIAFQRQAAIRFAIGLALVAVPFAAANVIEYGNVAGPHVAANLAPLTTDWLPSRLHRGALWFLPDSRLGIAGIAALALIAVARGLGVDLRRAQLAALVTIAILAIAAAGGSHSRDSLWHAWPVGFLLLLPTRRGAASKTLWALVLIPMLGIWLSSTHDGGAQWGPRFVLICTPALVLLAAASGSDAAGAGYARRARHVLLLIVLLAGVWTTRAAYRELRGTKTVYAEMVDTVERLASPGAYVVSNLWWFDQIAASLHGTRTFLYADDAAVATSILRQLASAGAANATLVWSRDSHEGESLAPAIGGTCFRLVTVHTMTERSLSIGTATCVVRPD